MWAGAGAVRTILLLDQTLQLALTLAVLILGVMARRGGDLVALVFATVPLGPRSTWLFQKRNPVAEQETPRGGVAVREARKAYH
jgi:hypothetical protein